MFQVTIKNFTKCLVIVSMAAGVVFLGGCFNQSDAQQSSAKPNDQWIIGRWVNQQNARVWVFNADRTGFAEDGNIKVYAIAGDKIAVIYNNNGKYVSEYRLSSDGKFLILGMPGAQDFLLRKEDGN